MIFLPVQLSLRELQHLDYPHIPPSFESGGYAVPVRPAPLVVLVGVIPQAAAFGSFYSIAPGRPAPLVVFVWV